MLAELVAKLVGIGKELSAGQIKEIPGHPDHVMITDKGSEQGYELLQKPAPRRRHELLGLSSLIEAIQDKALCPNPVVWVGPKRVSVFCNDKERTDELRMEYQFSAEFAALTQLATAAPMDPKALIQFLRFQLGGGQVKELITALRRLNFQRTSTGARVVEHGRESLGRSVEESVQQADKIPTDLLYAVAPFDNQGCKQFVHPVELGVEIDSANEKIIVRPLAGALDRALQGALADLADTLQWAVSKSAKVYLGAP